MVTIRFVLHGQGGDEKAVLKGERDGEETDDSNTEGNDTSQLRPRSA